MTTAPVTTAPPKTAQTTLAVLGKLLGTLLIWLLLLRTTDLSGVTALVTASAVSAALTLYLYKTIPLVLAGQKSLGSVAQDMLKMAEKLDQVKTGEVGAFRESSATLSESLGNVSESFVLGDPSSSSTSASPSTAQHWPESLATSSPSTPADSEDTTRLRMELAEAASLMEMGYGMDAAAKKTGVPLNVLERLETRGNGDWQTIKREAHDHMLRRIGEAFRS